MDTILKAVVKTTLEIYNSNKEIAVKNIRHINDMLGIRVAYQIQAVFYNRPEQIFVVIEGDVYKIVSDLDLLKTLNVLGQKIPNNVLRLDRDDVEELCLDKKQHYFYYAVKVEDKIE